MKLFRRKPKYKYNLELRLNGKLIVVGHEFKYESDAKGDTVITIPNPLKDLLG